MFDVVWYLLENGGNGVYKIVKYFRSQLSFNEYMFVLK